MGRTELDARLRACEETLDGGTLGLAALFLPTGEALYYNADETFPTASTIKVAIVAELLVQRETKRLPDAWFENAAIEITPADLVGGSGVLSHLTTPGLRLSLSDLALLTLKISDNTASNLCLKTVGGPDAVNQAMHNAWQMPGTRIHRPIKFHIDIAAGDAPHTATGTPRDMCVFMEQVAKRTLHSAPVSEQMEEWLLTVSDAEMLGRHLNVNPYAGDLENAEPPFVVAHKPGAVTGVRNDAGIIRRGEAALAICIYTKNCSDLRWTPANRGTEAVAAASKIVVRHFFGE